MVYKNVNHVVIACRFPDSHENVDEKIEVMPFQGTCILSIRRTIYSLEYKLMHSILFLHGSHFVMKYQTDGTACSCHAILSCAIRLFFQPLARQMPDQFTRTIQYTILLTIVFSRLAHYVQCELFTLK